LNNYWVLTTLVVLGNSVQQQPPPPPPSQQQHRVNKVSQRMSSIAIDDSTSATGNINESFDVLILYDDHDVTPAREFLDELNAVDVGSDSPIKAELYDYNGLGKTKFRILQKAIESSKYIFVLLTSNFVRSSWSKFLSDTCLGNSLEDLAKQHSVIPIYTEKKNSTFNIPPELNILKGLEVFRGVDSYRKQLKLILKEARSRSGSGQTSQPNTSPVGGCNVSLNSTVTYLVHINHSHKTPLPPKEKNTSILFDTMMYVHYITVAVFCNTNGTEYWPLNQDRMHNIFSILISLQTSIDSARERDTVFVSR